MPTRSNCIASTRTLSSRITHWILTTNAWLSDRSWPPGQSQTLKRTSAHSAPIGKFTLQWTHWNIEGLVWFKGLGKGGGHFSITYNVGRVYHSIYEAISEQWCYEQRACRPGISYWSARPFPFFKKNKSSGGHSLCEIPGLGLSLWLKARSHCNDNYAKRMHSIGWMGECVFCVERFNQ